MVNISIVLKSFLCPVVILSSHRATQAPQQPPVHFLSLEFVSSRDLYKCSHHMDFFVVLLSLGVIILRFIYIVFINSLFFLIAE